MDALCLGVGLAFFSGISALCAQCIQGVYNEGSGTIGSYAEAACLIDFLIFLVDRNRAGLVAIDQMLILMRMTPNMKFQALVLHP